MSEQQIEICCERYSADFDAREVKFVRSKKAYKYGKIEYDEIFLPKLRF